MKGARRHGRLGCILEGARVLAARILVLHGQVFPMARTFQDHVVVVTGASRGIGRALALQLAEQRALLALAARDEDRLEAVADECRGHGARVIVVPTDVTERLECQSLMEQTASTLGAIDTLINNAGISVVARFEDIQDLSLADRVMTVNYLGSVYCTHYALPHLKAVGGRIVGVSSLTGKSGVPLRSVYAASKHAMAENRGSQVWRQCDDGLPGFRADRSSRACPGARWETRGTRPSRPIELHDCRALCSNHSRSSRQAEA